MAAGSSTMLCVLHPWTVASVGLLSQRLEKGGLGLDGECWEYSTKGVKVILK